MLLNEIEYRIKTATEYEIYMHLLACNKNFKPPLELKVNINEYSKKIFNKSTTFEAWNANILIGLLASYYNMDASVAYITNVSVLENSIKLGIGRKLLNMCIDHYFKKNIKEITLDVNKDNTPAINLYKKYAFIEVGEKGNDLTMQLKNTHK